MAPDLRSIAARVARRVLEAAPVRPIDASRTYYHGTPDEDKGRRILAVGLLPDMRPDARGFLKPVTGRVYLTPSLSYAVIYALGGDYAGYPPMPVKTDPNRYGCLLVVPGSELADIQPDEDSVGEFVYQRKIPWLNALAARVLTQRQLVNVREGLLVWWAQAGKKLLKHMTPAQCLELIDAGAHVANGGRVQPSQCWRIDKLRSAELKRDGSNFFQIAERIA